MRVLTSRQSWIVFVATAMVLATVVTAAPAMAQGSPGDLRGQYVADFEVMESKFNELAGAMDADMYGWRPMDGVRTVSEVYMLIVAENYLVPAAWGAEPPDGVAVSNAMFGELAGVTIKREVLEYLEESFAYMRQAVASLADEQMHETIQMFGQERTVQEALFMIAGDMHEHLGQAIAYARMNEVVPPWTARQ